MTDQEVIRATRDVPVGRLEGKVLTLTAYDYDRQQWVHGEAARQLRIRQIREELALLRSDGGDLYAWNTNQNRAKALVALSEELVALSRT